MLLVVAATWLLAFGTRTTLPTLFPQIKAEFAIDNATAGAAFTVLIATSAVAQFPSGLVTDRLGERVTLVGSAAVGALAVAAFALAPGFGVLLGAAVLLGLCLGLYGPPRATLLSKVYAERDGTALGLTYAAGSVGAALLPPVAALLATRAGWRTVFWVALPLFALTTAGLFLAVPRTATNASRGEGGSTRESLRRLGGALRDGPVLLAAVAFTLVVFSFQGMTAFLPLYLVTEKGLDQTTAATLFGLFFATGILAQPLAGHVADTYGERTTLVVVVAAFGVGLALLPVLSGVWALAGLCVLLRAGQSGTGPVTTAYLVAALPDDVSASGLGVVRTVYLGVGSLGSTAVGLFADAGRFDAAFLLLAGLVGLSAALYRLLPVRRAVE